MTAVRRWREVETSAARRILRGSCAVVLVLSLLGGVAWAFWTTGAAPGSSGASAAATVNQGSTPSVGVSGREVTVDWAATTLSNGDLVSGYQIQRFDADTLAPQPIGAGCTGTVTATSCTETRVPAGRWVYSVTAGGRHQLAGRVEREEQPGDRDRTRPDAVDRPGCGRARR